MVCESVYPVSVDDPQAARVGANPLLFDMVEHVDEQRAVHLVSQIDGCVTLKYKHQKQHEDEPDMTCTRPLPDMI